MIKKFFIPVLVCTLAAQPSLMAKRHRGAELIVSVKDGHSVRGELITVKKNSILLLEQRSKTDVTMAVENIEAITIVKKSKLLQSAGLGLLAGWATGVLIGAALDDNKDEPPVSLLGGRKNKSIDFLSDKALIGGAAGLTIGGIVGFAAGKGKTYEIAGKSDSEIQKIMTHLRSKARI